MKILYIGNKLSKYGTTPTSVETLGLKLSEFYKVITISDKKNKVMYLSRSKVPHNFNKKKSIMRNCCISYFVNYLYNSIYGGIITYSILRA